MAPLLAEIRRNPLLWLLLFVPAALVAERTSPAAHTLLFILSVLAIVPLAALLSHATESVAAKTGDTVGGLLNATLGNLTELVIALAALRAGQYMLVKASVAGAIVTNTLFMLGASFLLGGFAHRVAFFYAPKILGGRDSRKAVAGDGARSLAETLALNDVEWRRVADDLMLTARVGDL